MKNEHGFSLVELLIVVAIIAIIAAIAVPSLLTARQAANEASAIQGCRTIGSAEIAYAATNNQLFTDLATLGATTQGFMDSRFIPFADAAFRTKLKWLSLSPIHRAAIHYAYWRGWNSAVRNEKEPASPLPV